MQRGRSRDRSRSRRGSHPRATVSVRALLAAALCGLLAISVSPAQALEPGDGAAAQETAQGTEQITGQGTERGAEQGDPQAEQPVDDAEAGGEGSDGDADTGTTDDADAPGGADEPADPAESKAPTRKQGTKAPPLTARSGACDANSVYLQSYDGRVGTISSQPWSIDNELTVLAESATAVYNSFVVSDSTAFLKQGVNGLGVTSDGTKYAFARLRTTQTPYTHYVGLMMTGPDGKWVKLTPPQASANGWFNVGHELPIAGAVDPATGRYVFGGFGDGAGANAMTLYEFDGASIRTLGKVTVSAQGVVSATTAAGDIAFDSSGNLYMVRGQSSGSGDAGTFTITSVSRAALDAARGSSGTGSIPSTTSRQVATWNYLVGGIAVLADGSLALANQSVVWRVDPANPGESLGHIREGAFSGTGANVLIQDLASCASATTLSIEKDIVSRAAPTDQFTLALAAGTGAPFMSGTTAGATTGAREVVPPTLVMVGGAYTVSEIGAGSPAANLGDYTSSLACRIDGVEGAAGVVPVGGAGTASGSVAIPAGAAGRNITCTFTNRPIPSDSFVCAPGEIYALDGYFSVDLNPPTNVADYRGGTATIRRVNTTTLATTPMGNFGFVPAGGQANAMGISPNGQTAYAVVRTGTAGNAPVEVRKYSAGASPTTTTEATAHSGLGHAIVAGAVDPSSGNYWVAGQVSANSQVWGFSLHVPGSGTIAQQFRVDLGHSNGNGDLLFDSAGNMYLLAVPTTGNVADQALWVMPAASIQAAMADPNPNVALSGARKIGQMGDVRRNFHSVAWGNDGYIYASASASIWANEIYPAYLYRIDPVTGVETQVGASPLGNSNFIVDFASCASPYTLTLKKDIVERVNGTDQFGLRIGGGGIPADSAAAYGQTSGSSAGLQQSAGAIAGPIPVLPGGSYTITETGIGGTDLGDYDTGYVCRDLSQPGQPVISSSTSVTSLPVALPVFPSNGRTGATVECVFTNAPKAPPTGQVAWQKVDGSGAHLGGSEWTIVGPDPASTELAVADCVEGTAADCAGPDTDPRKGYFLVAGLGWGAYELIEAKAPVGFQLDDAPIPFEIGDGAGASVDVELEPILNLRLPALAIPLTGGLGTDAFLILGSAFAALLLAGLLSRHLRIRRIRSLTAGGSP